MFTSYFPKPKLFFSSFAIWSIVASILWYSIGPILQPFLSIAPLFGDFFTGENAPWVDANKIWLYQYILICTALFVIPWLIYDQRRWSRWAVLGSATIVVVSFVTVQASAWFNSWFGIFFDLIQTALAEPNTVEASQFFALIAEAAIILVINITIAVVLLFFERHYIFRWRIAMTDHYMSHWDKIRHVEGAAQRVQDDTHRFSATVEDLGDSFIDSMMTLLVFLPILYGL